MGSSLKMTNSDPVHTMEIDTFLMKINHIYEDAKFVFINHCFLNHLILNDPLKTETL